MRKRIWTELEIQFIQHNYLTMTRVEMATKLSCPISILNRKIKELALYKRRQEPQVGDKIGRLTILEKFIVFLHNQHKTHAKCKCDCGKIVEVRLTSMKPGKTVSCGCWKAEKAREKTGCNNHSYKHGKGDVNYRLYKAWAQMKQRCSNPKLPNYKDYGGRGIRVCEEWENNFVNFETWALNNGYNEELSIDRIDVNGDYKPDNCRWATSKEQNNNKRNNLKVFITAFGEKKHIKEWLSDSRCKIKDVRTLCYRIGAGWSPEDAITTASQNKRGC